MLTFLSGDYTEKLANHFEKLERELVEYEHSLKEFLVDSAKACQPVGGLLSDPIEDAELEELREHKRKEQSDKVSLTKVRVDHMHTKDTPMRLINEDLNSNNALSLTLSSAPIGQAPVDSNAHHDRLGK